MIGFFKKSLPAVLLLCGLAVSLMACSTLRDEVNQLTHEGEWLKAVMVYRKALGEEPGNVELKLGLAHTEMQAANYYFRQGTDLLAENKYDEAVVEFQQGLVAQPKHERLREGVSLVLARKNADRLYIEGRRLLEAGKLDEAKNQFSKALAAHPEHKNSASALAGILAEEERRKASRFALKSTAPITLNFRQTDLHATFEFLGKSFGINMVFDETLEKTPITLFAKNVTFEQALNLLLSTSKTFFKQIGPNTLLIAPETPDKRAQYDDQIVRTFQLNTISPKEMLSILKGVLSPKKIIVNETLNSLIIRDTAQVLQQVAKLVSLNDRIPAEVLVDVEILEVNRSKAQVLGLDFGSEASRRFQAGPSLNDVLRNDTITIPGITFRFFKQDVDARTLANPKVRVLNGNLAKIHIGDRVPLRASTIQDATGQTRTTFVYTDIGIRLNVEPTIHLDDSVTIKMSLEVSSLGQNLGTPDEPAFTIGTRNAETIMRLRDGETVILGGLIRDEERESRTKVPGLGDIPAVGALFTTFDDSVGRTEVLLTITPRIMRSWDLPPRSTLAFYSGTANRFLDTPQFSSMNTTPSGVPGNLPEIRTGAAPQPVKRLKEGATTGSPAPRATFPPMLFFSKPLYAGKPGEQFPVGLLSENLGGLSNITLEILFNANVLKFLQAVPGDSGIEIVKSEFMEKKGLVRIQIKMSSRGGRKDKRPLVNLTMEGKAPGISYLVYRPPKLVRKPGQPASVQVKASRVVIRKD